MEVEVVAESTVISEPKSSATNVIAGTWLTKSRMQNTQVETCFPTA